MMKKMLFLSILALSAMNAWSQEQFKGKFHCKEISTTLTIDLTAKNIPLKDLDFDETYGFLKGNLNGTWVILKIKQINKEKAVVRMVSDSGVDAQDVEFTIDEEGKNIQMKLIDEQNMKTIDNRKYVKLPKVMTFTKL